MEQTDVLLSLAEIAGVFVGFGALISVRSETTDPHALTYIRSVVWTGILVVIAALAPVTLSGYGIGGHSLWLACSIPFVVLLPAMWIVNRRTPEHRVDLAATPGWMVALGGLLLLILFAPAAVALFLVVIGAFPEQEPALYSTAVLLVLVAAALILLTLVYTQQRADPP
jgi:hypothetical protein